MGATSNFTPDTPSEVETGPVSTRATHLPAASSAGTTFSPAALFSRRQLPVTLFVLLAALTMVGLGFWQLQRRQQRLARNAQILQGLNAPAARITGPPGDPATLAYRRVAVAGAFDYDREIVLRNRARDGSPGVHALTPLRIAGSDTAVLVDRGWIPYGQSSPEARRVFRGPATAEVRGIVRPSQSEPTGLAPKDAPLGPNRPRLDAWFWIDTGRIQQQMPYKLLPFYIEQSPERGAPDLPWRSSEPITLDEGPHLSYAIQWFSFAAISLAVYVARFARS